MKKAIKFFLTVACCFVTLVSVASSEHNDGKAQELEYEVKNGEIVRIKDRSRYYDELVITNSVSKKPSILEGVIDENGKEIKAEFYPFQSVSIRSIVIDNRNGNLTGKEFDTISFTGVKDLEEIVFKGDIVSFKKETKWFGLRKDSDWRKMLKKVVFQDCLQNCDNVPFLNEVKCISLGINTQSDLEQISKEPKASAIWKKFSEWKKVEKLIIPYELAINTNIDWNAIIKQTGLKDKEVFSQISSNEVDRVLLNIASSGEISDTVTKIRYEAVENFEGKKIFLPYGLNEIIGSTISERQCKKFSLKKNAVLFYPEIDVSSERKKLEKSQSFFSACRVSLTTPYASAVVSVNGQGVKSDKKKKGSAYVSAFELKRKKGEKSSVGILLNINGKSYPVGFYNSKGAFLLKPIPVEFYNSARGFFTLVITIVGWAFVSLVLIASMFFYQKKRASAPSNIFTMSLLVAIGLFLVFFGNGQVGVVQYVVDRWLTDDVMSYLNASFVSSLVISVTTTLVKFVVGLLQSVSGGVVFLNIDLAPLLAPVQDVLDKISTYSWISTGVLAFVRIFCQIIRDAAHVVWPIFGVSMVLSTIAGTFRCSGASREIRRWLGMVSVVCGFLALGLPCFLWGASCISGMIADITGNAFENSMRSFGELAESLSVSSVTSLSAMKELMLCFTDAVAELTSASMYYVANKAFDCFVVPLGLYFFAKKAFSSVGDKKEMELARIRELIDNNGAATVVSAVPVKQSTTNDEVDEKMVQYTAAEKIATSQIDNIGVMKRLKTLRPEWVTALCGVLLCILVAAGNLCGTKVVNVRADGNVAEKSETVPASPSSGSSTGALAWIVGAFFVSAFIGANYCLYRKAMKEKDAVAKDGAFGAVQSKLALLKEKGFWFDLPLYLGLLGTVIGFLIISWAESLAQVGRVVSYFSTITGILTSVIIHAKVSLYRAKALREGEAKDE